MAYKKGDIVHAKVDIIFGTKTIRRGTQGKVVAVRPTIDNQVLVYFKRRGRRSVAPDQITLGGKPS